jgi:hypothetical protein
MKKFVFAGVFAAAALVAAPSAFAAQTENEQVALCAAAFASDGTAPADQYRAKFVKSKGAAVKTVTIRLVPTAGDGDAKTAECQIKKGEVVSKEVKA